MLDRRTMLAGSGAAAVAAGVGAWAGWRGMGSMAGYEAAVAAGRGALPPSPDTRELIRFATLAPSGHNTQPWTFEASGDSIAIRPDLARRTPVVDPDDHHLFASLGAAAETLALAAAARGRAGELAFDPDEGGTVRLSGMTGGGTGEPALFEAIPRRQSTRGDYDGTPVGAADLATLASAAAVPGVDLVLITERRGIDRIADLVLAGNAAQMADPAFLRELKAWLRFSPHTALATGDGLFGAASGSPALPEWLGPTLFDWTFTIRSETDRYARAIASSAGLAVFVGARADPEHWVLAGRAAQRFALQATALGLRCAFLNQPVEVASLRPDLAALVGLPGRRPDLVMRFGRGPAAPFSARRPLDEVILA